MRLLASHIRLTQRWNEEVKPYLSHGYQSRIVFMFCQCFIQAIQIVHGGLRHAHRMNAQRVAVAQSVGQAAHGGKVTQLYRRVNTMHYIFASCLRTYFVG